MTLRRVRLSYNLVVFLLWLASGLPMSLLVLFFQARGLNLLEVGFCFAVYSGAAVLLELPTGGLADTLGRRKVGLLASLCLTAGTLVYLLGFSLPVFLLAAILTGAGRALFSGSLEAWYVDASLAADREVDLQAGLAQGGAAQIGGLGTGVLVGGFLPKLFPELPPDGTAILTPLSTALVASVGIWLVATVAIAILIREPERAGAATAPSGARSAVREAIRLVVADRELSLLLVPAACWGLAFGAVETFWQPYFAGLIGGSAAGRTHWFGGLFAASFLFASLGNALATPLSRALERRHALVCGLASTLQMSAIVLLALQSRLLPAAVCFWLIYAANGLLQSPQSALLNQRIPSDKRATLLSLVSLCMSLGGIVGDVGVGYLARTFSIRVAWIAAAASLLASVAAYLRMTSRFCETAEPVPPPRTEGAL
jgi:MFS family permease